MISLNLLSSLSLSLDLCDQSVTIYKIFFSQRLFLTHKRRCEIVFIIRAKTSKTRLDYGTGVPSSETVCAGIDKRSSYLGRVISKSSSVAAPSLQRKPGFSFIRPRLICERSKGSLDDSVKPPLNEGISF